jgi:hypothetical protein
MKFTMSTLVALCMAVLDVNIVTSWTDGSVTVYQDKPVDLATIQGREKTPLQALGHAYTPVLTLPYGFTNEGHPDRIDIINDGQVKDHYLKVGLTNQAGR